VTTPDPSIKDQGAFEASRAFARYWWAECRKIAEQIDDPAARWDILVKALARVGRIDEA
jgi:hypothetical protein